MRPHKATANITVTTDISEDIMILFQKIHKEDIKIPVSIYTGRNSIIVQIL